MNAYIHCCESWLLNIYQYIIYQHIIYAELWHTTRPGNIFPQWYVSIKFETICLCVLFLKRVANYAQNPATENLDQPPEEAFCQL